MAPKAPKVEWDVKGLAWCGIFAPPLRLGLILLLGSLDPEYSHMRDYISELGARGAPSAVLMNVIGTVLVGVLLGVFSLALYRPVNFAQEDEAIHLRQSPFWVVAGAAGR